MKKSFLPLLSIVLLGLQFTQTRAQISVSASDNFKAHPIPDRTLSFSTEETGDAKPIIWGLDTAWPSEDNIRRGVAFMGANRVDLVRASFQPTMPLVDGELQAEQVKWLNTRLGLVALTGLDTKVVLNCDHPSVDAWYKGNAANWAKLIDVTTKYVQDRGRTVVTVSPFNEPDYSATGQGTVTDFFNIATLLKENSRFDGIRISGGNTLNTDQALVWYNQLSAKLDEGNTHQLAGSFDNFANFYTTVRAKGHHATGDELHNVMEAMVGVEYGMQTGIWWGTAEYARGEFVIASDGERLANAEHRPNWTAASVYRNLDDEIQLFGGTSERQSVTTTYRFVSKEKDVYFDGYGPQREYTMVLPGGTGYQQGQTNAEKVVNVTWGDDIQPVIDGRYVLVNRKSQLVLEVANGSTAAGANLRQGSYTGATYQQWNVAPVDSRIGGDFSYFSFSAVHSGKAPDILNFSLTNGGNIIVWDAANGANQQWFLEYAEDGWFYIRSRHSAKCLEVEDARTTSGANIQQWQKDGGTNQQWRFLPIGADIEFDAPSAPTKLVATANAESVQLDWNASADADVAGYTIFRSEFQFGPFNTIARNITTTSFVDNTTTTEKLFYYVIKAVDKSLNVSDYSNRVFATATGAKELVVHLQFDGNAMDSTTNLNHGAISGNASYVTGEYSKAIALNGTNAFVQLPTNVANQEEITISTWLFWYGGQAWQRIFDFGSSEDEYMYLTPKSGTGNLHFGIKNGGDEQGLDAPGLPFAEWTHVAVTLSTSKASMYVNGVLVSESDAINISPLDFKPILNYIGRSQFSDPLMGAKIDDFRIYNYALTAADINSLFNGSSVGVENSDVDEVNALVVGPVPANDMLLVDYVTSYSAGKSVLSLFNSYGKLLMRKDENSSFSTQLNTSAMPDGIYVLKVASQEETSVRKIIVEH